MTAPASNPTELTEHHTTVTDPLTRPLLAELTYEYSTRYEKPVDLDREYPPEEFGPPGGAFLLLLSIGPLPFEKDLSAGHHLETPTP
ncbi:hypothetical protein [Streptomyces sp. NPDC053560]|uniref:hypothetical protein n=1 Tax=Streptomyces sp. NPDC053560 TaxID=3365711 RepID=UPI0037D7AD68